MEKIDSQLKSLTIVLKEFPLFSFDQFLYNNNNCDELINSINNFNELSNQINFIEIFIVFSNALFFQEKETELLQCLVRNTEQLDIINEFLSIYQHNLILIKFDKNNFNTLTKSIEKIERILIQNPRSYLTDIIFHFSLIVEKIKIKYSITPDKNDILDEIHRSHDLHRLINFHGSISYDKKIFTYDIVQQIDAFYT
ncbi:unnamed protein product, partial [Rotaria sordida]